MNGREWFAVLVAGAVATAMIVQAILLIVMSTVGHTVPL